MTDEHGVDNPPPDGASSPDDEPFNAGDERHVKARRRKLRAEQAQHAKVMQDLTATEQGRWWLYDRLAQCHVFDTSFDRNAMMMAFREGERNVGLALLAELVAAAPDRYIEMLSEARQRDQSR